MPPAKKPATKKAAPKRRVSTQKYIRNLREVPIGFRLETGRRIDLLARGRRGDTMAVSTVEQKDHIFLMNRNLLFEVITESEAEKVVSKQDTNRVQVHPAMSQIRNAKGEEYEGPPIVQTNEEVQGTKVGTVDERGHITRAPVPGSEDNPIRVPEEKAAELDEVARRDDLEGPEAGIGNLKVTKSDVQTT